MTTMAPVAANNNVRRFYVYQHRRNDTGEVFYVGKGSGNRAWNEHPARYQNRSWKGSAKYGYTVEIVCDALDEKHALELEVMLIQFHGRRDLGGGYLANLTDGGEGTTGWMPTAEQRAKIGSAHKGKVISAVHRDALSKAHKGKKMSESARARIGDSARGRTKSLETRTKLSMAMTGRKQSPETLKKLSVIRTGRRPTQETILKKAMAARLTPPRSDNTSGYKGVSFESRRDVWVTEITVNSERTRIGSFAKPEDAARAYDAAALAAWGAGNCYLNFPAEHSQAA